jgi:molybdopterin-guanine dinucleotide biosynthesis protein A
MDESTLLNDYTASAKVSATACVLAGGKSTRMGTDKALLPYDGRALIEYTISCMDAFEEVLISAADADIYTFTGVPIVTDRTPDRGPIEGLAAALTAARHEQVCFRPVDTPLVPPELHQTLFTAIGDFDACVPTYQGRPEPLLGCYAKSMIKILEHLANSGIRKVSSALSQGRILEIPLEDLISRFGDPGVYLINANDPKTFSSLTTPTSPSDPAK